MSHNLWVELCLSVLRSPSSYATPWRQTLLTWHCMCWPTSACRRPWRDSRARSEELTTPPKAELRLERWLERMMGKSRPPGPGLRTHPTARPQVTPPCHMTSPSSSRLRPKHSYLPARRQICCWRLSPLARTSRSFGCAGSSGAVRPGLEHRSSSLTGGPDVLPRERLFEGTAARS